eukprot:scaffold200120_cov23-Tisochrysis_lutea.AAC.1
MSLGMIVMHETLGKGIITAMGYGTLHGAKKVEFEYYDKEMRRKNKKRKWVSKDHVQVEVGRRPVDVGVKGSGRSAPLPQLSLSFTFSFCALPLVLPGGFAAGE